ncbi:MAG: hypothetical protein EOO90_20645 [Pedobacter sp.]|nr:MAG: hypothetical protein EOO90_20645 [Pedobacter sp.]
MTRKLLLIHPMDSTTKFLLDPVSFFRDNISDEQLDLHILEPTQESHQKCFDALKAKKYDIIFFLGHGSSGGVQGSSGETFECVQFLSLDDLKGLEEKSAIFLSCNSGDFLKKSEMAHIGFGFMPTDWKDIQSAREVEHKAYEGVTEEDIESYRKNLTEILKKPILKLLADSSYTMQNCYNDILLLVNRSIALTYKDLKRPALAYLMFELKQDLVLRLSKS